MLGVASRSDIKQQIATIDMTIEIYNLQVLGRVLGKLNQVPDVIDARRLHGGKVKRYYLQSSLIYLPVILYVACVLAWPGSPGLALKGRRKWRSHRPCQFVLAPPVTDQRKPWGLMGTSLSPTAGSLRLFKFVSDEFVTASPPACNSNYLGYMSIKVCNRKLRSIKKNTIARAK